MNTDKRIIAKRLSFTEKLLTDLRGQEIGKVIITQDELMFTTLEDFSAISFAGDDCRVDPDLAAQIERLATQFKSDIEELVNNNRKKQIAAYKGIQKKSNALRRTYKPELAFLDVDQF